MEIRRVDEFRYKGLQNKGNTSLCDPVLRQDCIHNAGENVLKTPETRKQHKSVFALAIKKQTSYRFWKVLTTVVESRK
jgi:hypothetical protein